MAPARRVRITKRFVDSLEHPERGQMFHWDSELPGFGLRVGRTAKSYVVQRDIAGRTVRETIGKHGVFTPEESAAILRAGASEKAPGQVFNLGGEAAISLLDLARMLIDIAGAGSYTLVPFPEERKRIDIGDFQADPSKIREALGWQPRVGLRDGLERTVAYYRQHKERYL